MNNTPSVSTDSSKIFFNLQYSGDTAERMVKSCIKKLSKCLQKDTNMDSKQKNGKRLLE